MSILFILILILLIMNPSISANQVINSLSLWITSLLPTLYPSLICIDIISTSRLAVKTSNLLHPIIKKIFNTNSPYSTFIILSYICGCPASTKLILNAKTNNQISEQEANNLIYCFSNLSLPFTILVINNYKLILLYYLFSIVISSIIMHIINKKTDHFLSHNYSKQRFTTIFITSIKKNIELMFNILGIIMFFKIVVSLLLPNDFIGYSYIEILGGLANTNNLFIKLSSLGFLSISIHLQILAVYPVKYYKLLFFRFIFFLLGLLFLLNI